MALKINVNDLIQYRYQVGAFTNMDTRRVTLIDNLGFWVEGGYHVAPKDVITVIPATENQKSEVSGQTSPGNEDDTLEFPRSEIRNSQSRPFPLEPGQ